MASTSTPRGDLHEGGFLFHDFGNPDTRSDWGQLWSWLLLLGALIASVGLAVVIWGVQR